MDRSVLVLMADKSGSWDLCVSKSYLISGITRCCNQLDIIIVGYIRNVS